MARRWKAEKYDDGTIVHKQDQTFIIGKVTMKMDTMEEKNTFPSITILHSKIVKQYRNLKDYDG